MAGETVVGALRYDFTADTSGLKSGLSEVTSGVRQVTDQLRNSSRAFEQHGRAAAQSVGLARHEMINLTRQLNDVGVSLASGMSPLMVLIQQGAQISDVFQSSNASVGAAMRQILFNAKAMSIGVVAAFAGIGAAALVNVRHLEKLSDTARALGTNRSALNEFNRQGNLLGVDPAKMNEELLGLAENLRKAQIAGGDLADKLAAIGINIKSFDLSKPGEFARLFEQVAEKVRNGNNELDKLNALKLLGLSSEFRKVFDEGGDAIRKFARDSAAAAETSTKPIEEKLRELRTVASNVWKSIVETAIDYMWQLKQVATQIINAIIAAFKEMSVSMNGYMATARKYYGEAKEFIGLQSSGEAAKQYKKDTRGLGMQRIMARGYGSAGQELSPPINVGGDVDLSGMFAKPGAKPKAGSRGGAKGAQSDQIKNYIDNLREAASLAQSEADNWSKGNIEREKAMALVKAENIAKQEGKTLTDEQRAEISNLAEQAELAKVKVDGLRESQYQLNDAMREFADMIASAFDDLLVSGKKAKDVLSDISKILTSSVLRGALTGEGMFGGMMGLSGKEGRTGGLIGAFMASLPKFANGGVLGAGKWGIAGEAGPELVKGPASITPMGRMSAAPVTVNLIGAPEGTRVTEKTDSNGQRRVDVVFDERVAASLASPYGANAMRGVYGSSQRIARR
jgi:hypothetical protein